MSNAINISEKFVFDVCQKSFLSLWSYANPQGKNSSKELCDVLVVCDPHVVIISVKEIQLRSSGNIQLDHERWERKAVHDSIKQIKGAARWLDQASHVIQRDGKKGLPLPSKERRIYHRIAIALGGKREISLPFCIKDSDFFHVFDEKSFFLILRHLDTVTDFVEYLSDKEGLLSLASIIVNGGEEDLLAFYIHSGREFPTEGDLMILEDDLWDTLVQKPEFQAKIASDHESYAWDKLIEGICEGGFDNDSWYGPEISQAESSIRILVKEHRFSRRALSNALTDFLNLTGIRSRSVQSLSGVVYVFCKYDQDSTIEARRLEVLNRSLAILNRFPSCDTVIGIGLNTPGNKPLHGFTTELVMLQKGSDGWPEDYLEQAKLVQNELGYFKKPIEISMRHDEYPDSK